MHTQTQTDIHMGGSEKKCGSLYSAKTRASFSADSKKEHICFLLGFNLVNLKFLNPLYSNI